MGDRVRFQAISLEDFYTGYRKNLLAPDEVVAFIDVPLPEHDGAGLKAYYEDASVETKIDLAPLMEEMQRSMGKWRGGPPR